MLHVRIPHRTRSLKTERLTAGLDCDERCSIVATARVFRGRSPVARLAGAVRHVLPGGVATHVRFHLDDTIEKRVGASSAVVASVIVLATDRAGNVRRFHTTVLMRR